MNEIRPIDANVAIEKLHEYVTEMEADIYYDSNMGVPEDDIEWAINEIPTLEYAPVVHAHWIVGKDNDGYEYAAVCSHCDENCGASSDKYCSNCGAIMDEEAATA